MSRKKPAAPKTAPKPKGNEAEEKPERHEKVVGWVDRSSGATQLGEIVANPKTGYLHFATNMPSIESVEEIRHGDGTLLIPRYKLKAFVEARCLSLPSAAERNGNTAALISDIKAFIRRFASVPDAWLDPIAYYILMTWVFDRFSSVGYLRFLGETGTGKTRLLEICAALCYRALQVSGNLTGAVLFRSIDMLRGTLLVDEGDFKDSHAWSDIVKTFNNGYQVGKPVLRCDLSDSDFDPEPFWVFGPKVISTRQRFQDNALERRCFTFETGGQRLDAHVPVQLTDSFYAEALGLRNRLLGWRFDNFDKVQLDQSCLRHLDPAVQQIGVSLVAVAPNEEAKQKLIAYLGGYAEEAAAESPKGVLATVITEFKAAGRLEPTCGDLALAMNQKRSEYGFEEFTARGISSLVRALGHTPEHTRRGSVVNLGDGSVTV